MSLPCSLPAAQSHPLTAQSCPVHLVAARRRSPIACARPERCLEVCPTAVQESTATHRRAALLSLAGAALVAWQPSAHAAASGGGTLRYGKWDGTSAADGSCAIGDPGIECRKKLLGQDGLDIGAYGKDVGPRAVQGTAVPEFTDSYAQETLHVAEAIQKYADAEPFDPSRPGLVKTLKQEGGDWAAKYARGGNARKQSARRFYIAYDALLGHLVSNGLQPMAKPKMAKVLANVDEAKQLMAEGK